MPDCHDAMTQTLAARIVQAAFDALLRHYADLLGAAGARVAACRDAWPGPRDKRNTHDARCQPCQPLLAITQSLDPTPFSTYPKEAFARLAESEEETLS